MTSRAPSSAGRAGPRTAGEMGTLSAFIANLIAPMAGSPAPLEDRFPLRERPSTHTSHSQGDGFRYFRRDCFGILLR
jgi:hypothetical protein